MKYLFLTVLFLGLSCNSTKPTSKSVTDLGSEFKVMQIEKSDVKLTKNPTMILDFDKNVISGNAGCNHYSGGFVVKGNKIKIDNVVGTKMYCQNMKIEKEFFKNLATISSFNVKDNQFLLFNDANELVMTCDVAK